MKKFSSACQKSQGSALKIQATNITENLTFFLVCSITAKRAFSRSFFRNPCTCNDWVKHIVHKYTANQTVQHTTCTASKMLATLMLYKNCYWTNVWTEQSTSVRKLEHSTLWLWYVLTYLLIICFPKDTGFRNVCNNCILAEITFEGGSNSQCLKFQSA